MISQYHSDQFPRHPVNSRSGLRASCGYSCIVRRLSLITRRSEFWNRLDLICTDIMCSKNRGFVDLTTMSLYIINIQHVTNDKPNALGKTWNSGNNLRERFPSTVPFWALFCERLFGISQCRGAAERLSFEPLWRGRWPSNSNVTFTSSSTKIRISPVPASPLSHFLPT